MGYEDSVRLKAERKFIKDLLKSLWNVNTFFEITIKKIIKPYIYKTIFKEAKEKRITKNFYLFNKVLYSKMDTKESFEEFKSLNEKEKALLRFSAFFHDLGKGRSKENSIIGARIAKEFAKKIGLKKRRHNRKTNKTPHSYVKYCSKRRYL